MRPVFSVIIPVYNRAHLIGECLSSVFLQTEIDFEVIIVDNNSTDNLASALTPFSDKRIHLIKCATPGPGAARNAGIRVARGRFFSFIDSDDLWRSDVLETARPFMEKGISVVYAGVVSFRHGEVPAWNGGSLNRGQIEELPEIGQCISRGVWGTCLLCAARREMFDDEGQFDESLHVGEDLDWALRHISCGPAILLNDQPRLAYRAHLVQVSSNQNAYRLGTLTLLKRANDGTYELGNRRSVRRALIRNFVGSVVCIALYGSLVRAFFVYVKVLRLGCAWREFQYLLFPEQAPVLLRAALKKLWRRFFVHVVA